MAADSRGGVKRHLEEVEEESTAAAKWPRTAAVPAQAERLGQEFEPLIAPPNVLPPGAEDQDIFVPYIAALARACWLDSVEKHGKTSSQAKGGVAYATLLVLQELIDDGTFP